MVSGRRPAILALAQCLPFPPHSGVTNRIYHVLAGLQRRFVVFLVPFLRRLNHPTPAAAAAAHARLSQELSWVAEPIRIPGEWNRVRWLFNHAASAMSHAPFIRFEYAEAGFGRAIQEALTRCAPALIHADSLDLYQWFPGLPAVPLAVTHHNIESELLRIRAGVAASPPVKGYINMQARRLEVLERSWAPRVATNVMMSALDAERLRALAPSCSTFVVPNGVDVEYFRRSAGATPDPTRVVFLGPTAIYPNRQAVDWFLEGSWAGVRKDAPSAALDLVGAARPVDAARYGATPGVTVHGHVPDVRPYLAGAAVSIVPIQVGGGTRLKILDAWSMGTPVISTTVGCEGLATVDGENIIIRDDPAEFAEAVSALLRDRARAQRIGAAGRDTAVRSYAWEAITDRLGDHYQQLIG
ncbi:MAG TPA: glycosyltransferase family 4 protein [Gemmatimonadales bacterium]|nr:glycosyltransferase family 4 protein [Gemmatimonadales bacterium]